MNIFFIYYFLLINIIIRLISTHVAEVYKLRLVFRISSFRFRIGLCAFIMIA